MKLLRYEHNFCSVYATAEKQVMQGACGFSRGVYIDVNVVTKPRVPIWETAYPKKNVKATQQNVAYTQLAVAN